MKLTRTKTDINGQLSRFFKDKPVPGPIALSFDRYGDFFAPYRIQSDDYETLTLINDEDQVEAMASFVFREGEIEGERQVIGYATDLRVSPSRRAILSWSQHFLPVLEEEKKKRNCRYVFSVVAQSQTQAYNAFIRPRTSRRHFPRYHMFRRFRIVCIHGRWPFAPSPISSVALRQAREEDLEALANYIVRKKHEGPLSFHTTPEDFVVSLKRWAHLAIEDFILALDRSGKIIGCVAPWNSENIHKIQATDFTPRGQTLQDSLKALSLFRLTHPLTTGAERQLHFKYLTHFFADNPDLFYSLLYQAWEETPTDKFLCYPHFDGHLLSLPPKPFISSSMRAALYCILSPNDPQPDFLRPITFGAPPDFELPLL